METFKNIRDTHYSVSNMGNVRNDNTGSIIKARPGGTSPYLLVSLNLGQKKKTTKLVHRLVAEYFLENPDSLPQVNHKDGNKLNNNTANLEWVSAKQNMKHAFDLGLYKKYNNQTYKGKFGAEHNRSIGVLCNGVSYGSMSEASRATGVSVSNIHFAVKRDKPLRNGMHFQLSRI